MNAIELLKSIPIFSCLDNRELEELSAVGLKKTYPKNTYLLNEGDITDSLYVICEGKVKTIVNDEHGKEIILSITGPGEYFGEMALIDGEPRSASILTREQTQLLILSRSDVERVLEAHPDMVFRLLKGLNKRLRETTIKVKNLAFMDVYGRIARLLTQLAKPKGDKMVLNEALTHQEIANMVGSSREMVSRILKELIVGEYISVEKKIVTINKKLPYSW